MARRKSTMCCFAVLVGAFPVCVSGATLRVPDEFDTIQECIDAAQSGIDECVVSPGTYNECINFIGKAITVRSSDGPALTVIDGTGLSCSVVKCVTGEGSSTILNGFTITGGNPAAPFPDNLGGGMYNVGSSPTVIRCVFFGNEAGNGGGMYNRLNSNPTVANCKFIANTATTVGVPSGFGGGGMAMNDSNAVVTNCTFVGNSTINNGGGMYIWGNSSVVLTNCTFRANTADGYGGGLYIAPNGGEPDLVIANCLFWQNRVGGVTCPRFMYQPL